MRLKDELAIHEIVHREIAICGKEYLDRFPLAYSTWMNKLNPHQHGHRLLVQDLFDHCLVYHSITGKTSEVVHYICRVAGGVFVPLVNSGVMDESLYRLALEPFQHTGKLVHELLSAREKGSELGSDISPGECALILENAPLIHQSVETFGSNLRAVTKWPKDERRRA